MKALVFGAIMGAGGAVINKRYDKIITQGAIGAAVGYVVWTFVIEKYVK